MIPVSIVTGFLGSGKTTLIGRLLRDPSLSRTAVIVNEFGEVGLDHDLIASSSENLLALTTGCLCCAVRGDLVKTLLELLPRRHAFDRMLIETSGLADPAPILHALMTDRVVGQAYTVDTILTVVDALLGADTLAAHPEARRQVALADVLVLSKTDLAGSGLPAAASALNPGAPVVASPDATIATLFTGGPGGGPFGGDIDGRMARLAALPDQSAGDPFSRAKHSDGIESIVLQRAEPMPALALTLLLQALAEHCGARLLRLKGLVGIEEMPGQPAVIHGVQHVVSAPVFLDRWPSDDTSTRLVFIGRGIPRYFPARLLAAIEAEVREQLTLC